MEEIFLLFSLDFEGTFDFDCSITRVYSRLTDVFSEKCNDHLRSRNKQLFRFLGLKEIKTLNYLTQMLLS